ncbi:MAG: efflux RND transporter periplasmic adaptor subunit, partial [Candidatus Omnitrophota bacterium]|nr:efflux RND transporter periplasmic adaptor subunit [Candidatus Omnitrophota bacterium]
MKKNAKAILIGFIALWVVVFGIMWGRSIFKKTGFKKENLMEMVKGIGQKKESPEAASQEPPQAEAVSVRCYKVAVTDFKDDLPVMGTIKGAQEIQLKFEMNGVIDAINSRQGDVVNEGDIIASLNKKDAKLRLDYAKNKLESAKTQALANQKKLEIHKKLYEIGGIIKAKLEEVELEAKSAELQARSSEVEVKSAEEELKKTDLRASREGVLGTLDVEVGEFVTPADKVGMLYDIDEVFVELGIVENDINKVTLGQKVVASVDAHPGETFTGVIDYVFPVVEGKSKTLTVRSRIKNPDAALLPGMFVRSLITVAEFKNAI